MLWHVQTYGAGVGHPLSGRAAFNLQNAAVAYATSKLTASNGNAVVYTSGYSGDVVQNAYLVQTHVSSVAKCWHHVLLTD